MRKNKFGLENLGQTVLVLWLAGVALRITLLAIPPVLPHIQRALSLSQGEVGWLTGLPTLLFALIAVPGAAVVARFGVYRALFAGLGLTALAGAARAVAPGVIILFLFTIFMSIGIAIVQPALPALVRHWVPRRVGMATAIYSNGMLAAEAIAVALTLPFILPLLGGSWRATLAFWSMPVVLAMVLLALRERQRGRKTAQDKNPPNPVRGRWWPDWRDPLLWKLGLVTGGGSAIYYTTNGFLPGFLTSAGHADLITAGLTAINLGQIPPTIILLLVSGRVGLSRTLYIVLGVVAATGMLGIMLLPGAWFVASCAIVGFCCGFTITLGFTLPAILAAPGDVHRLAGAMITIGYLFATLVPIVGGYAWDATGNALLVFALPAMCGLIIAIVGASIRNASSD